MHPSPATWSYGRGNQILIGFVAAFMFGVAALLFNLPALVGGAGHDTDWMVECFAIVMTGFGVFVSFGLTAVVRTRISLDANALDATVPAHHNWLLIPSFRSIALPLSEIRSVERRREIVRWFGVTSLRESLSVVTAGGERIGLISNTNGPSIQFPLSEIADAIASAAGTSVTDAGTVRSNAQGLYGEASSNWTEPALDPASASQARRIAIRTAQICGVLVLFTIALRACT
jgi:hypothetical protein